MNSILTEQKRERSKLSIHQIEDDSKEGFRVDDMDGASSSATQSIISIGINRSENLMPRHSLGAYTRKHMFNINDEILNMQLRDREESREQIQEPTLIASQNLIGLESANHHHHHNHAIDSLDSPIERHKRENNSAMKHSFGNNPINSDTTNNNSNLNNKQTKEIFLQSNGDRRQVGRISAIFDSNSNSNVIGTDQAGNENGDQVRLPSIPKVDGSESPQMSPQTRKPGMRSMRRDLTLISKNRAYSSATESLGDPRGSITNNLMFRMKISWLVRKFSSKMKYLSQEYTFKQLEQKHYDIIGDKSASYTISDHCNAPNEDMGVKLPGFLGILYRNFYDLISAFESVKPINPGSRISVLFDIFYAIALLIYLYLIPVEVSFQVRFDTVELIIFIIFAINFIITFNKCYFFKGRMISDRMSILKNFFKTQFLIDSLVFIFWRLDIFKIIGFIKFFDINRIVKRADDHFQMVRKSPIIFTLTTLVVKMTLIAQIAGCTFHYVARLETENGQNLTWIDAQKMTHSTWVDRYIISIYFAFITMMTVGYGDVSPVNNQERIYVIFMTLLSSGIFGYVVNTIGELYLQQAKKQEEFQKRKQEISLYLDQREIDTSSKQKVLNYLEYSFQFRKKKDQNADVLFADIPQNLVEEILLNHYGRYLFLNKIMKLNFSEKFLKNVSLRMQEKNLAPGETLYTKGSKGNRVYFLASGKIDFILGNGVEDTATHTIDQIGSAIGLRSSLIEHERPTGVNCSEELGCSVVFFEMEDFKRILLKFPKDYERFCELRDDILLNQNTLDIKCDSCSRYDHIFANCPLVTMRMQKPQFIAKYQNKGEPNVRQPQSRWYFKFKTISQNSLTKAKLRQYRMSLVFLIVPEMREQTVNFKDQTDKYFFKKMPTVKIVEGGDMEADMEEYNIYEAYDTMAAPDDQNRFDDEEEDSSDARYQDDGELYRSSMQANDISGENNLGSSSYSSSHPLSGQQIHIPQSSSPIAPSQALLPSTVAISNSNLQNTSKDSPFSGHQKMSLFANSKQSLTVEITPSANDSQSQVNINTSNINQGSARNLSFRRERGDSFLGPMRNNLQQYSQQRSLQSRVKSNRKLSGTHQHSGGKNSFQVSFQANPVEPVEPAAVPSAQPELYDYEFEKIKIFEKYFPHQNYNNIIKRINISRRFVLNNNKSKRRHKTLLLSPRRRKSKKISQAFTILAS